jgi:hypothetical protein
MFACEAVDLDFLDSAPIGLCAAVHVGRPPSGVFAAFAHDPANWGEFFQVSTKLAVTTSRGRMALALAARSGSSASKSKRPFSPGKKVYGLRSV